MEQKPEKEMTEEELKVLLEQRQKDWEAFNKRLKDNPTMSVTNEDLSKAIEFISDDMGGMAQMIHIMGNNMNVLAKNFQQVMQALNVARANAPINKTKSGIILP